MPRPATITYEQVAALADEMKAAGLTPTTRMLRARLGSGSNGTVGKLLAEWWDHQRQNAVPLALPAPVQRGILEYIGQEVAAAKAGLEAMVGALKQEVADLADDNERLTAALDERDATIAAQTLALSRSEGREAQLTAELEAARRDADSERAAAEAARVELAKAQLRLEAVPQRERELAEVRAALDQEGLLRIAAEQAVAVGAGKMESVQQQLAAVPRMEEQLAKVRAEVNQERTARMAAEQAAAVASARLDALAQRLDALQQVETELDEERQRRVAAEQAVAVAAGKLEAKAAEPKQKPVRQGSIRAARPAHR
jgi:colicin import membrane protein